MQCPNKFGTTKIDCLDRELQQALAAEALIGVLCCQMCTSSRREFHACALAFSGILVLTNKRRTTARTRLVFHSCWKDSDGCSHSKYDGVNYSAKVVKKSHIRKGYAIFCLVVSSLRRLCLACKRLCRFAKYCAFGG